MKGTAGTFILRISFTGLAFLTSFILARVLGAAGYGIYSYALSWIFLLSVPAGMGFDRLIVREVASYRTRSEWGLLHGLLKWTNRTALLSSVGLSLIAASVVWQFGDMLESQAVTAIWIALIILPFNVLTRLRQETMRGIEHVVLGQLPETLLRPVIFLVLIGVLYSVIGDKLTAIGAVGLNVLVSGIAFLIGAVLLLKYLPDSVKKASADYRSRVWMQSALPLLFINSMHIINAQADIIMLGTIRGTEMVGVYNIAKKVAEIIVFILFSVNMALAPKVSSFFTNGEMEQLQRVITRSTRIIFAASLPIAIIFIFFGYWILLVFGQDFTRGAIVLTILSIGQIVNASMGSAGMILVMTKHEKDGAAGFTIGAVLNIVLNVLLIPGLGIKGAAIATATSTVIWNLFFLVMVHKRLGIDPTALGTMSKWRKPT